MSTVMTWQVDSTSSEQTERLGHNIGAHLKGGEIIELRSDLGGGKTTFVRGLAAGIGSEDVAGSPSFTISRIYKGHQVTIHHYDFYRLPEAGLMSEELSEVLDDPHAITVVEWADVVEAVLPTERVIIQIHTTGENDRRFTITMPEDWAYLKDSDKC